MHCRRFVVDLHFAARWIRLHWSFLCPPVVTAAVKPSTTPLRLNTTTTCRRRTRRPRLESSTSSLSDSSENRFRANEQVAYRHFVSALCAAGNARCRSKGTWFSAQYFDSAEPLLRAYLPFNAVRDGDHSSELDHLLLHLSTAMPCLVSLSRSVDGVALVYRCTQET